MKEYVTKAKPRPYQQEAIDNVLAKFKPYRRGSSLKYRDRGQLIMPCGSGKTFTGMWIAEGLGCQRLLLLMPSLSLIKQNIDHYLEHSEYKRVLCVCSDSSIKKIYRQPKYKKMGAKVRQTTDVDDIADFLENDKPTLVMSTYDSVARIAEAFEDDPDLKEFDLALYDEAHMVAGFEGDSAEQRKLNALAEDKVKATKRLFMTATPRVLSESLRDSDEADQVFCMRDTSAFGPVFHEMTFYQAIKNKLEDGSTLLTDFRVMISAVPAKKVVQKVKAKYKRATQSLVESYGARAALMQAARLCDLNKCVVFTHLCAEARELQETLPPHYKEVNAALGGDAPGIETYYVDGTMKVAERQEQSDGFAKIDGKRKFICNAGTLATGWDVKPVDSVAFMTPKRSPIEVAQMIGRAIRPYPGKEIATVVIPVLFNTEIPEDDEELYNSVCSNGFEDVVNTIRAMTMLDDRVLGEVESLSRAATPNPDREPEENERTRPSIVGIGEFNYDLEGDEDHEVEDDFEVPEGTEVLHPSTDYDPSDEVPYEVVDGETAVIAGDTRINLAVPVAEVNVQEMVNVTRKLTQSIAVRVLRMHHPKLTLQALLESGAEKVARDQQAKAEGKIASNMLNIGITTKQANSALTTGGRGLEDDTDYSDWVAAKEGSLGKEGEDE